MSGKLGHIGCLGGSKSIGIDSSASPLRGSGRNDRVLGRRGFGRNDRVLGRRGSGRNDRVLGRRGSGRNDRMYRRRRGLRRDGGFDCFCRPCSVLLSFLLIRLHYVSLMYIILYVTLDVK